MSSVASATLHRSDLDAFVRFVRRNRPLCVITGAGCSTNSGIFDYRDQNGNWKRPPPVLLDEFRTSIAARRRYWARSMLAWRQFSNATPNSAHRALVHLTKCGYVTSVITQNVDDLHEKAGQPAVVPLHGSLRTATCLSCGNHEDRDRIQARLEIANPRYVSSAVMSDAGGEGHYTVVVDETFTIPECLACGGILKPDVVFFGGNVDPVTKVAAENAVRAGCGLLVVGSSLMVYSSLRLVKLAKSEAVPIAIVGLGATRGDDMATLKIRGDISTLFDQLIDDLNV